MDTPSVHTSSKSQNDFKKAVKEIFMFQKRPKVARLPTLIAILILLVTIPLTIIQVNRLQDLRQHANSAPGCVITAQGKNDGTISAAVSGSGSNVKWYVYPEASWDERTQQWTGTPTYKDQSNGTSFTYTGMAAGSYQLGAVVDNTTTCLGWATVPAQAPGDTIQVADYFKNTSGKVLSGLSQSVDGSTIYNVYNNNASEFYAYTDDGGSIRWLEDRWDKSGQNADPFNFTLDAGGSAPIWMNDSMQVNVPTAVQLVTIHYRNNSCGESGTAFYPYDMMITEHNPSFSAGSLGTVDAIKVKYDYFGDYEEFTYAKGFGLIAWTRFKRDGSVRNGPKQYFSDTSGSVTAPNCANACTTSLKSCTVVVPTGTPTPTGISDTPTTAPGDTGTPAPTGTVTPTPTTFPCTLTGTYIFHGSVNGSNTPIDVRYNFTSFNPETGEFTGDGNNVSNTANTFTFTGTMTGPRNFKLHVKDSNSSVTSDLTGEIHASGSLSGNWTESTGASGTFVTTSGTAACINTTITPTPSTAPASVNITVFLHGIGKAGDNPNPLGVGNNSPKTQQPTSALEIYNSNGTLVGMSSATITYNAGDGNYTGKADVVVPKSGQYIVKVWSNYHLKKRVAGFVTITPGKSTMLPPVYLIAGDTNNDNMLDILDYNTILGCFSTVQPAQSCSDAQKQATDLDNDSNVNQYDYNLFLREVIVQSGD